jgi:hypothetical protein
MGINWTTITRSGFFKPKTERSSWQKVTAQRIRSGHEALATRGCAEAYDERTTTLLKTTSPARLTQLNRSGYCVYGPIPIAAPPPPMPSKRKGCGKVSNLRRRASHRHQRPDLAWPVD